MQWLRLYDDLLDDPKCQQLDPVLFRHWINLLCLANKGTPRGQLPDLNAIAFRLRLSMAEASLVMTELTAAGFIDTDGETTRPHNWDGRQRQSDNVAARVAKHRSNVSGNVTSNTAVTLHETLPVTGPKRSSNVSCNANVTVARDRTDTDTDTDTPPGPPKGGSAPATKTRITDDFEPDLELLEWAAGKGFSEPEIEHHTEAFRNHWRGEAGPKASKHDWRAAWRTWLLRERPGHWPRAPTTFTGVAIPGSVRSGGAAKGGKTPAEIAEYGHRLAQEDARR